jgi:hypothetical protein
MVQKGLKMLHISIGGGGSEESQNVPIQFALSFRLSACNRSRAAAWISTKFDTGELKSVDRFQFRLKPADSNTGHFTGRLLVLLRAHLERNSLNVCRSGKCSGQKLHLFRRDNTLNSGTATVLLSCVYVS